MEEYIEKNQLKEKLRLFFKYESFPIADIEQIIDWLPVVPKHGRWTIDGKCSQCGHPAPFWAMASTYYRSNYCPNCGAKMDEVKE